MTCVAQWAGHCPAKQELAGSIPYQGACLGCVPCGEYLRGNLLMFLSFSFSLPSPLSENGYIKSL